MDAWKEELCRLIREGRKIDAIKLYREKTGVGLKEAKEAIEQLERGDASEAGEQPTGDDLERQIVELLKAGKKISAIKLYREQTSLGLKEAKDAVEGLAASHGIAPAARSGCFGAVALLVLVGLLIVFGWVI
jgi:ribosomal protein L7/L12